MAKKTPTVVDPRSRIVKIDKVRAEDIAPHPGNWRDHPEAQADAIAGVMREVGDVGVLLAWHSERNGGRLTLIDGHLRRGIAPGHEYHVAITDLTDAEADYVLATHDPLANMAIPDAAALDALLTSINTSEAGVQKMLADLAKDAGVGFTPEENDAEPQVDKAEELNKKWQVETGQVWRIGEHRLLCGDSTRGADVARLMAGAKANLCFTSPPYGQQRDYTEEGKAKVSDWDGLMRGVFGNLPMTDDGQVLVNLGMIHREGEWIPYWDAWIEWMREQGWRRFGWYVWDQGPGMPGDWNGRLAPSHEFIWHFNRESVRPEKARDCKHAGEKHRGKGLRRKDGVVRARYSGTAPILSHAIHDSVFRVNRQGAMRGAYGHPAPYPVGLPFIAMQSWPGVAYEPFCGSGTTLIAAEQLGRKCYGMEISPAYCAVILQRMSDAFPGIDIRKI